MYAHAPLNPTQDMLVVVVANMLYYNAPATLVTLQQTPGALPSFFGLWMQMIFATRAGSTKPKHFRRMHDKKVWVWVHACMHDKKVWVCTHACMHDKKVWVWFEGELSV
jgi:hypothetical protein